MVAAPFDEAALDRRARALDPEIVLEAEHLVLSKKAAHEAMGGQVRQHDVAAQRKAKQSKAKRGKPSVAK